MKNVTSDKRNLWMFPLGTVGRDMIYNLFTNFIFTYILFTRHLTAAQLGAVTAIMVGARVFDALNDPVMGNIIERTRSRYGKFKPWLVIGILSTSVVVYLAFNTSLQGWSFIAFFGVIYFLYSITYTMHDISYWGMVSALSSDPHVRDSLTSRTNLFAGIGGVIASILIPMLTTGSGTLGGSTATAYGRVALVICILAPLFLCATIFGVRERRDYNTKEVPPVSFKKIWNTITGNPQILWISLVFLLQQIGNDVVMGGLGSTYVYFAFGYEGGLYSLFNTVGLAATALLMIFYPMLAKRFRRKQMMDKLMLLSVIGYAVMIVSGLALSGSMVKFWILTVGYMVANLGQYGFYLIMMISLINTVEYNEYLRGERDEAIIELVHDAPAPPLLGLPLLPREFRPDEADRPAVVNGLARQNVQIDAVRIGIPEHRPDIVYLPVGRRDLVAVEDVQPLKPSLRDGLEIERLGKLLPVDEYDGERSAVET